jgi:transcriptional regulator with XRE-family HTH domain
MQHLGHQVRRTREFLGLSQQQLAQRAGVSQGAVSRFEGGRALSTPFLAIVRLNVALARALAALDASTLSDEVRRYLHYMEFLATPPEASETSGTPVSARALTSDSESEAWMRLYWEVPPQRRTSLLAMARAAAKALHE